MIEEFTFVSNVHIYHLDHVMFFDHFAVAHIHDHHFDDVNDGIAVPAARRRDRRLTLRAWASRCAYLAKCA